MTRIDFFIPPYKKVNGGVCERPDAQTPSGTPTLVRMTSLSFLEKKHKKTWNLRFSCNMSFLSAGHGLIFCCSVKFFIGVNQPLIRGGVYHVFWTPKKTNLTPQGWSLWFGGVPPKQGFWPLGDPLGGVPGEKCFAKDKNIKTFLRSIKNLQGQIFFSKILQRYRFITVVDSCW